MNIQNTELIYDYCDLHSSLPNPILPELERQTHLRTTQPHMLSGHLQGELLTLLAKMIQAKTIVDIGTFTGYSAICLAAGVMENGIVHTIDIDEEKKTFVHEFIEKAGFQHLIKQHIGNAMEIIPTLDAPFDIVFIDADKEAYAAYFDIVIEKMSKGGLIISDNVLWKGKVIQAQQDKKTSIIHAFNQKIMNDARVENLLLPLRDGLMIARVL
jgi:caffeoyl-CoA O-methyltransferase